MASRQDKRQKKIMKFGPKSSPQPQGKHGGQRKRDSERKDDSPTKEEILHDEKICVLCCEEMSILAKGSCDHVVCFKCSSRMRVLCLEKYCAVCRLDLDKVAFIEDHIPFKDLDLKGMLKAPKFGIFFQSENVKNSYEELLYYSCPICTDKTNFGSFAELRRHARQVHDKQYCDLCVKNLKIFPKEFRVYTRSELVTHRKTGDPDDKSHKGHPQCDFCSERYLGNDELLTHLRKNHFWCHFCEKDGKQDYFADYEFLREHFRDEHFLCEQDECVHEKFTSAFRSDIDFQAHKLAKHSRKMSKVAAKQARQLNVDIDYGTRKMQRNLAEKRSNADQRSYSNRKDVKTDSQKNHTDEEKEGERNKRKLAQESVEGAKSQSRNDRSQNSESAPGLVAPASRPAPSASVSVATAPGHVASAANSMAPASRTGSSASSTVATMPGHVATAANSMVPASRSASAQSAASATAASASSVTAADIIKGRANKQTAERKALDSSREQGNLSWSKFSNNMNLTSQDAFPSLGNANLKAEIGDLGVSYKNATAVRKKDTKVMIGKKITTNGYENPSSVKATAISSTKQKSKSPPGIRKVEQEPEKGPVSKAPPGMDKTGKLSAVASQKAPPGMTAKRDAPVHANGMPPGIKKQTQASYNVKSVDNTRSIQERNLELIQLIKSLLSDGDFDKFKDLSGSFRRSEINASQYYDFITDLLGTNMETVFFELVDLLPDKLKQEELLAVYNFHFDTKHGSKTNGGGKVVNGEKEKFVRPDEVKIEKNIGDTKPRNAKITNKKDLDLILCKICGISLSKKEAKTHMDIHVENDFPELPVAAKPKLQTWQKQPKSVKSAWGKPK